MPFLISEEESRKLAVGDLVWIPNVKEILAGSTDNYEAFVIRNGEVNKVTLHLGDIQNEEKDIIESGCLINYYATR